ncbi:hypothetical protein LCGC14_1102770 [marine sediment metagenome]|uniref:Uncharacterized protein n=1 Tax=marine sediment metagenome TaxID=412755 RepID=A0A0F9MWW7_9ZZZZ
MKRRPTKLQRAMERMDACLEAREWVGRRTLAQCWKAIKAGKGYPGWAAWWMSQTDYEAYMMARANTFAAGGVVHVTFRYSCEEAKILIAHLPKKPPRPVWWKDI